MICPKCKTDNNGVIDTRKYDTVIIRIRLCKDCLFAFRTQEIFQDSTFLVEKSIETHTFESK